MGCLQFLIGRWEPVRLIQTYQFCRVLVSFALNLVATQLVGRDVVNQ